MNNYTLFHQLIRVAVYGAPVLAFLAWILAARAGGWHARPATICIAASFTLLGFSFLCRLLATPLDQQSLVDIVAMVGIVLWLMFRGVLASIHDSRARTRRSAPAQKAASTHSPSI